MKDRLTLMEVSQLWRESINKHGEGGFVAAGLDAFMKEGAGGLDYVSAMGDLFNDMAEKVGSKDELYAAITDLSHFVMLVFAISIVGSMGARSGPFAGIHGSLRRERVSKQMEVFLETLMEEDFERLMSVLISSAVMVGIGVAVDEGFTHQGTPKRGDPQERGE